MKYLLLFAASLLCQYGYGTANEHPLAELPPELQARLKQLQEVDQDLTSNGLKIQDRIASQVKTISLQEIQLEKLQFEVKRPTVRMDVNIAEGATVLLPQLSVSGVAVDLLNSRVRMDITAPSMTTQGAYSLTGHVKSATPVSGQNTFTMKTKGLKISAEVKLNMVEEIVVENIKFTTTFMKAQGQFGDIQGVDIVLKSAVTKAIAEELMKAISPQLQNKLREKLRASLQSSLAGVSHCSLAGCQLPVTLHPIVAKEITQNINEIVDQVLATVSKVMKDGGLDPIALPDIGIDWGFSIFKLQLGLYDGFAEGISNLARAGDWFLHTKGLTQFSVDGSIALFNVGGQYTFVAKYMGVGADADFIADVSYLDITIDFSLDLKNCSVSMDNFEIGDIGHVDITVDGFIFVDWLVELVTEFFTNILLGSITNIANSIVQDTINDILDTFNICGAFPPQVIHEAPLLSSHQQQKNSIKM